jgi:hypothetical protein
MQPDRYTGALPYCQRGLVPHRGIPLWNWLANFFNGSYLEGVPAMIGGFIGGACAKVAVKTRVDNQYRNDNNSECAAGYINYLNGFCLPWVWCW